MNNIGGLIEQSVLIIKKSSLIIATILSLFSATTSTSSSNNFKTTTGGLGVSDSTTKQAIENTNKIIGVLNEGGIITPTAIATTTKKLNELNIIAPTFTKITKSATPTTDFTTKSTTTHTANTKSQVGTQNIEQKKIFIEKKGDGESAVNIRCENKTNNTLKVITGSGVLISSSGLILTAAHVAAPVYAKQNGDNSYTCVARIRNPATGSYPIKIVFIDPIWISKYYTMFDKTYSETGENDIALLQIDSASSVKISDTDIANLNKGTYANLNSDSVGIGDIATIKAYPSDIYGKAGIFTALPRQSETNSIEGLLNFDGSANTPYDLLETKPSSLGQSGASGGGIFNNQGQLIGIISNMISSDVLLKNKIRALSINYIDNRIKNNLGMSIFEYNQ
ncbi:MAG: serine protease [bacterium]